MTEYTPTTAEVRECFSWWGADPGPEMSMAEQGEAFDRWLTSYTAQVQADALREAADEFSNGHQADKPRENVRVTVPAWLNARADSLYPAATGDGDETKESLRRGIADSAAGRVVDLGDFTQFAPLSTERTDQ